MKISKILIRRYNVFLYNTRLFKSKMLSIFSADLVLSGRRRPSAVTYEWNFLKILVGFGNKTTQVDE